MRTTRGITRAAALAFLMATTTWVLLGCGTAADESASRVPDPGSVAPVGFPVGTWTKEITPEDFAAAGVEDESILNNIGSYTRTYETDGTWTEVLIGPTDVAQVNPIFRGTYVVDGDRVAMTTTFPPDYAGSTTTSTWRWEEGRLWTTLVSSPDPLELKLAQALDREPWLPG